MKKLLFKSLVATLIIFSSPTFCQNIVINEFMSDNELTLDDAFSEPSDWIEIYNNSASAVNIKDYALSDDPLNKLKWKFPEIIIEPGEFLTVFASSRDTIIEPVYWSTKIDRGDEWKYFVGVSQPPSDWKELTFNDAAWNEGPSGFGYGDGDDETLIDTVMSLYCRKIFYIDNVNDIRDAVLHIDFDDGFIAYLNGVEIARSNITGTNPPYTQAASSHEALIKDGLKPVKFEFSESNLSILQAGANVLAIQLHNGGPTSSDLTLIPFLSIKYHEKPDILIPPSDILDLPSHERNIHTNFKISADGEVLYLSDPLGVLIHYTQGVKLKSDQSYGRKPDGSMTWKYFDMATPGKSNNQSNLLNFSHQRGYYTDPVNLTITAENDDSVFCTFNGNLPMDTTTLYTGPVLLDYLDDKPNYFSEIPTTQNIPILVMKGWESPEGNVTKVHIVRCRSYRNGEPTSPVYSQTYFIESNAYTHYTMPIISLITPADNLFDYNRGIYVPGIYADPNEERSGNFYQNGIEWERPVHIEYFETNGQVGFYQDAGMRVHGLISRQAAQKTLRLYARNEYGKKYFKYQLLPQKGVNEYKRFILRTPMSSWGDMFHDAFVHNIMRNLDIEVQDFRPVIVFLNGEYWGIHNLRDYIDENFIASLHEGVIKENINLLENNASIIQGTNSQYNGLINYINTHDLSVQSNYNYVKSKMDMNNYLEYTLAEMYAKNQDWPGNNIRYWQPDINGKWRWILNDMDASFWSPEVDMFPFVTATNAQPVNGWVPNPPWSTLLFRKLLTSDEFKREFVCKADELLKTTFNADTIVEKTYEFEQIYEPEMEEYIARWHFPSVTVSDWKNRVESGVRRFAQLRPAYFLDDIKNFFDIDDLEGYCATSGSITIKLPEEGSIFISPNPCDGIFMLNFPLASNLEGFVQLYNMTGQLVFSTNVNSNMNYEYINVQNLPKGVYIINANLNSQFINTKIIIQ